MITGVEPDELAAVLDLVAAEQAHHDRGTTMLGEARDGIEAELGDVEPDWTASVRVAREGGRIVGAVIGDWDPDMGRAWILGPWVADGSAGDWDRWARPLVEAVLEQLPESVTDWELAADVSHTRMASLGASYGLVPSEVNHVYTVDAAASASWPEPAATLRAGAAADAVLIHDLHEQEFPASYASAESLLPDPPDGKYRVLVAEEGGALLGYAAGRVQADGEGYLDFIAVSDAARGRGLGRDLVVAIARSLLGDATTGELHLTVQDHRAPARRLYESLGFRRSLGIVGYRLRS